MSAKTILLADENPSARRNIAHLLMYEGYEVHEADSGEKALNLIRTKNFDVVITELGLHGTLNGLEILKQYDRACPGRTKILLTGDCAFETIIQAKSISADFFQKPVSFNQLLIAIRKADNGRQS